MLTRLHSRRLPNSREAVESETFAVSRVKTRPSVTSSRTIESRPFKFTSRLARNGGRGEARARQGEASRVVRQRITGMRILVIRLHRNLFRVLVFDVQRSFVCGEAKQVKAGLDDFALLSVMQVNGCLIVLRVERRV